LLQFAGLAPGPFAGLVLADNGADVIRVDRPNSSSLDVLCRGKRSITINSKLDPGRKLLEDMISTADILIDPFRPGVLERLGLGPSVFLGDNMTRGSNERLIYARIAGYVPSLYVPFIFKLCLPVFQSQVVVALKKRIVSRYS
jgi:alpha-methylacyl-CoA racemase